MLDDHLLQILVCPNCRGAVEYRQDDQFVACVGECRFEYSVVDDIPHMLIEEARKPSA